MFPQKPPKRMLRDKSTNRAYVLVNGKKKYFGQFGSVESSREFVAWFSETFPASDAPAIDASEGLLIAQCIRAYTAHVKSHYVANGKLTQEAHNILNTLRVFLSHSSREFADEFGPRKLIAIQRALAVETVSEDDRSLKYSRSTINAHIRRIRRCLRWCASRELIPASVVTALDMVDGIPTGKGLARETDRIQPVPIESVVKTIQFLSPTVAAMVRIQTLCGMRPQDVCRMTASAIDRTSDVWLYRPADHKTAHRGKSLVKAIPESAQAILTPFLIRQPDEPIFSPSDSLAFWRQSERKPSTVVRAPRRRQFYTTASYGKAIVYAIARAAKASPPMTIAHWTPNQLRHLIATQIREQSGIEDAQLFLGHAKPDITLVYAERSAAKLAEIARQIVSPFETETSAQSQSGSADHRHRDED